MSQKQEKKDKKEKKKKKEDDKSLFQRLTDKLSNDEPEPDEMVEETLTELKDVVSSMRGVFEEFEEGYDEQLDKDRSTWKKIESKFPSFLQSSSTQTEERRMKRIKNNKENLTELEDNLSKLEMLVSTGNKSLDELSEAYVKTASVGKRTDNEAVQELEARMDRIEKNLNESMNEMTAQITLIKSALDNMAGQLDEQGVKLQGIDSKIDTIDGKLDKAHEMLKKISKQITGNRLIMLAAIGGTTAIIVNMLIN